MTPEQIFYKIASFLVESGKMVTLDKLVSKTGIEESRAREALISLSEGGLVFMVEVEEFDENCYQANSKTHEFCEKIRSRIGAGASSTSSEPQGAETKPIEVTSDKVMSEDPLENYLLINGAPENVMKKYRSLLKEKNFYKKRSEVWEKHIGEMVNNVTKELK